jgi:hypothetical protein
VSFFKLQVGGGGYINITSLFFFFFDLAPGIRSFTPTNPRSAQAISKESPISAFWLIQMVNP